MSYKIKESDMGKVIVLQDYTKYVKFFREHTLNEMHIGDITLSLCMIAVVMNPINLNFIPERFQQQLDLASDLDKALFTKEICEEWFDINPILLMFFPDSLITPEMEETVKSIHQRILEESDKLAENSTPC